MAKARRVNLRAILANPDLRRELMIPTLQATQAREGIETTREQAERAYYVVTEGERIAIFDLKRFRGLRGQDQRHASFVRALADNLADIRLDVARRDFGSIQGAPLSYREVHVLSSVLGEHPRLEDYARVHQGVITRDDQRFLRNFWEVSPNAEERPWVPLHKGGSYSRFYYSTDLVIDWSDQAQSLMHRLRDKELYFKPGLTWPLRTQRGLNVRYMPAGCVFSHKGGGILPIRELPIMYTLGLLNSSFVEYIARALTSFGSWEVHVLRAIPVPSARSQQAVRIGATSQTIYEAKEAWDSGNEVSTCFGIPWLLRSELPNRIPLRLDQLAGYEVSEEARIRHLYNALNDDVFELYEIPGPSRGLIEETLGKRPPEVLWPQMEGQSVEQKRMEHIFRLLSYAVKRVVEADEDGVVPFFSMAGEPSLNERVLAELHSVFPDRDIGQVETEIVNELNNSVKGYRRTRNLAEWLENVFFEYHSALYKNRPIFWHIASSQGSARFAFGALIHYHKFNRARMAKLRSQYLREAIDTFRREAALADKEGRADDRADWQSRLEEAQELDRRLQWVQEGHREGPEGGERDFRILTPWKTSSERPLGWDPDLDDGVKVNIEPLQKAGVLRIPKVV